MRHIVWMFLFFLLSSPDLLWGKLTPGPISGSLAGAGVAAITPSESAALNPATLPHITRYYMGAAMSEHESSQTPGQSGRSFTLTDGKPETTFPASLSYSELKSFSAIDEYTLDESLLELSIGRFMFRGFAFGMTFKNLKQSLPNATRLSHFNASCGLLFTPLPMVALGLVFDDVLGKIETLRGEKYYPSLTAGLHYQLTSFFNLRFDVTHKKHDKALKNIVMIGIETSPIKEISFRFGLRKDNVLSKLTTTAGFGWNGPRLGFDYAIQMETSTTYGVNHLVDMKLHF